MNKVKVFAVMSILLISSLLTKPIYAQKSMYSEIQLGKIRYANSVLKEAIQKKDSLQIAEAYYLLGKVEANSGKYLEGDKLFLKSMAIQEKYGDSYKLGRLYVRLHEIELNQNHYEKGFKYLSKALTIFQNVNSDLGLSHAYTGIARFYLPIPEKPSQVASIKPSYDSAIYYFKKAESYTRKINDTLSIAYLKIAFGNIYKSQNNPKAISYYQSALNIFSDKNKKSETLHTLLDLAETYIHFNQNAKAYPLLLEAQKMYNDELLNEYDAQFHLESLFVNYFRSAKNWQQAYKHLEIVNQLERKQILADNEGAVSRLNIEYETQKKELLLNEQQKELKLKSDNINIQQTFLYSFGTLLLLMIGLSIVFYKLYRKNQRISIQNLVLVKEQNHRVKNNLQVVSSLLSLQSNRLSDNAAKTAVEESMLRVEAMAILHRKLYDSEDLAVVNLQDFTIELVEGVLQTFGFGHTEVTYNIDNIKLSADQALPVGLIINELVTNSCKYAFTENFKPLLIISCYSENDEIIITVSDNGNNSKALERINSKIETSKSFGMRLIQMQIAQLYGSSFFEYDNGIKFSMKFIPINQ